MQTLDVGARLHQALGQGVEAFRALAAQLGYSPFAAHDLVRVYRAFARVSAQAGVSLDALAQDARQLTFAKLSLIASILEKDPASWAYWLELAQNLPLQDLQRPVHDALKELRG